MKDFLEIDFKIDPPEARDILLAFLDQMQYDSFQETDEGLKAYILEKDFDSDALESLFLFRDPAYIISYEVGRMENKNWNEEWETHYEPISIGDELYVRAPFHAAKAGVPYEILIMPKMSFGTGHHQTTRLMCRLLLGMDLKDKQVLDMGTGTGILGILSEMKGAKMVDAVDNFDWAVENTRENAERNNCVKLEAHLGEADFLEARSYDVVIANINRNVLLEDMPAYCRTLTPNGQLLLSGFFAVDFEQIDAKARECGGRLVRTLEEAPWMACHYEIA